ncbi:MAG: hypothetical protein V1834_03770 [Candidatus Micrarchaeota archaeon]
MRFTAFGISFLVLLVGFVSAAGLPLPGQEPWSSTEWPSDLGSAGCLFFYCAVEGQVNPSPEPPTYSEFDMISVCPTTIAELGLTKEEAENQLSKEYNYQKTCWFVGSCEKSVSCDCCDFSGTGKRCPADAFEKQVCSAGNTGEQCSLTLDCLTEWRRCTQDPIFSYTRLPGSCKEVTVLSYQKDLSSEYNCANDYDCVKKDCVYRDFDLSVQGECKLVFGVGADECSSDTDCQRQHSVCVDGGTKLNKCEFVEGPGENECSDWTDCNRKACWFGNTALCMDRKGTEYQPGEIKCKTNADCEKYAGKTGLPLRPVPPSDTLWDAYGVYSLVGVFLVIAIYFWMTTGKVRKRK